MRKKLLFLATEDWFVTSHFLPLVRRALEDGYDVAVAARASGSDLCGARLIEMPFVRGTIGVGNLVREISALRTLLRRERPDLVHAIALKSIVLLLMSGAQPGRVFAVTGRGYLVVRDAAWTRSALGLLAGQLRRAVAGTRAVLLVENVADRSWVEAGAPLADDRVVLMPGAGIDPNAFAVMPEPIGPIVVGVAARLVWSKGIDIAVDAVRTLRASGLEIVLQIAGAVDADNPERIDDTMISAWRETPGVTLLGRVKDMSRFWAGVHIACLPSRGGEGLPRTLLEAAACGRPIVTTDTPGCADFVIDGVSGLVTPKDDSVALSLALRRLTEDSALRRRFAEAARARVVAGYTETHAATRASDAWRSVTAPSADRS